MKNKIIIWFILIVSIAMAQGPAIAQLSGKVSDSLSGEPVAYASITVYNIESNELVVGGITDESGYFLIDKFSIGTFKVVVDFIGYEQYILESVEIGFKGGGKKYLGEIKLVQKSLSVEGVTVVDDRPVYEFETDKLVYNASDDIISANGTAEDVLNKVPMVLVDQDGEVSLRGNSNVKILVNGRENRLGTEVDNIPASLIDKVEVITSPSAKYDPEGMAGIINIKLKRGRYDGLNGNIKFNGKHNANSSVEDMNGFTAYANYKTDSWNLYSSFNANNRMNNRGGYRNVVTDYFPEYEVEYQDGTVDFDYENIRDSYGNRFEVGTDYYLTKDITLNAEIKYSNYMGNKYSSQTFRSLDGTSYSLKSVEGEDDGNYDAGAYFEATKTYENPDQEMSFSISLDRGHDSEFQTQSVNTTTLDDNNSRIEVDYSYKSPIGESAKFEAGYDGRFIDNNESMNFDLGMFTGINDFSFGRDIHAVYLEYNQKLSDNLSVKPSLRLEHVSKDIQSTIKDTDGQSDADSSPIIQTYIEHLIANGNADQAFNISETNYFPDLHFSYNINEKQSIQFGLNKSIKRPGSGWGSNIRPFPRNVYNQSFLFIGNPFLKPESAIKYDLSFKSPAPMGFMSASAYYQTVSNKFEWYDDDRFENGDVLTFKNAENAYVKGVDLFLMVAGQVIGGTFSKTSQSDSSGDYELNEASTFSNMYCRINLPEKYIKVFDFEFGFYWMKISTPTGTMFGDNGTMWANIGVSKSFLDNRLSVSLSADNIFNGGGFQMLRTKPLFDDNLNEIASETTDVLSTRNGRTLTLSFKYNFGKLQDDKNKYRRRSGSRGGGQMDMGL